MSTQATVRARERRTRADSSARILGVFLALLSGSIACRDAQTSESRSAALQKHPRPPRVEPVLVFGIDGFEWSVVLPLVAEGRMPAMETLMRTGVVGKLKPTVPTWSPILWTTIATGKRPPQHGIVDFDKEPSTEGGKRLAYTSQDRKVKAFWNIFSDYGVTSDTLGWWITYPAEVVLGLMVAQTNTTKSKGVRKGAVIDGMEGQVWPPEEEAAVLATLAENDEKLDELEREIFGDFFRDLSGGALERWEECEWAFRADSTYVRVLEQRIAEHGPADVTSVYIGGTDVVGHRFWAAHDPASAGLAADCEEARVFGHVVEAYYVWVDRVIERILASLPDPTTVFIVSDHGMTLHPNMRGKTLTQEDLDKFTGHHVKGEPGVFLAVGPGIAPCTPPDGGWTTETIPVLGKIFDFCPTLLALVGIPSGEDMYGQPLAAVLDPARSAGAPPPTIPTHDDPDWRRSREIVLQIEEDPERTEQLEDLGYLGGAEEDGE